MHQIWRSAPRPQLPRNSNQWRRLHRARVARVSPTFTNGWAGVHLSRRTTNMKPPNFTDHHESTHQIDYYCTFRTKKVEGHDQKIFFAPDLCPLPHFQIRSDATDSNSSNLLSADHAVDRHIYAVTVQMPFVDPGRSPISLWHTFSAFGLHPLKSKLP